MLYALVLGVIIVAEIAVVVAFVAYQHRFRSELVLRLRESITTYYAGTPTNNSTYVNPISLSWDFTQFNLQCCGAISKNDFANAPNWDKKNPYQPDTNLTVPFTCCPLGAAKSWTDLPTNLTVANACATTGVNAYSQGCYDRLLDIITTYKNNFIIIGSIVGVVEVLAFLFAILLYRRKEDYYSL